MKNKSIVLKGRSICPGKAEGIALVSNEPISFLGGINENGIVIERGHCLEGKCMKGRVLVFPNGKGSTVGSYTIYRLKKAGSAPIAIVNKKCEAIVACGAIVAGIPCVDNIDIRKIKEGDNIFVDGNWGVVKVSHIGTKLQGIRGIIFDLNGTLTDDIWIHIKAYRQALKEKGIKVSDRDVIRRLGKPAEEITADILKEKGLRGDTKKMVLRKKEIFSKIAKGREEKVLFGGVRELLKRMNGKYCLGLFTGSSRDNILMPNDLMKLFKVVVAGTETKYTKPSGKCLEQIIKKMGIKKKECVYVGDMPADMKTARNAGVIGIGIVNENASKKELSGAGANILIKEITELGSVLAWI